jgi:hypothetical protein
MSSPMASKPTPGTIVLRPSFPCTGADLLAARACEQVVFGRRYGNDSAELAEQYGRYEDTTSFGGVFSPDGTAVGATRLIRDGEHGLKSLNDASASPWGLPMRSTCQAAHINPARTWDVGTFAVDSFTCAPNHEATLALFSVMFGAFRDNEVATFIAILDAGARRPIAAIGVQMLDLPGAVPAAYLGSSASTPVYRHVRDLHRLHVSGFADVHEQVFHGRGVDGMDARDCAPGSFELVAA